MLETLRRHGLGWKSGLAGVGLIALGMLVSGLGYTGRLGERFSPFNHFVSELGELGVSDHAWAFNLGLLLGGLCMLVSLLSLAQRIGGWLGALFGVVGVVCGLSGALVGAFPMNNLKPHIFFAMNFFNAGLICMLLFSGIALFGRPTIPRWLALPGLLSMLAFASFKFFPSTPTEGPASLDSVNSLLSTPRPPVWGLVLFEWLAVLGVMAWALVLSLALRQQDTGS
jgi:hypothetical membrane protein